MLKHTLTAALSAAALAAGLLAAPTPSTAAPKDKPTPAARHLAPTKTHFDLQAHRGGIGLNTESSIASFSAALELGVSTLELDTQVTEDGKVVVTHDRKINGNVCRDTAPAFAGDPEFPYVGKFITNLTLAQVKTLECGHQPKPGYDRQKATPAPMIELKDVFALVKERKARQVMINVETKVEAAAPHETAPREFFVRTVNDEIVKSGLQRQVTVQSFDWGALMEMHRINPRMPLVALTNHDFLQVGKEGASPWLGGIDADDFGGDFVKAAASIDGVTALSPVYGMPQNGKVSDPDFAFYVTPKMVAEAHALGLKVIPWTSNDRETMEALVDMGIDGLITDYPDVLREVMDERGMRLPKAYPAR
ncbi:glycerophosphodiester phosphodiesterase family protein [Luteococcus sp. OSA5]|uniref:glycerophosphodiester phosphodiesterase family protein n=1 Tax=Luteococcus sp. OSA5 TaxID=3401630 RepID=UPI003B42ED35